MQAARDFAVHFLCGGSTARLAPLEGQLERSGGSERKGFPRFSDVLLGRTVGVAVSCRNGAGSPVAKGGHVVGYAQHVGRIGALAVALGIGT
ncbi:MAG: hypothetical protein QOK33_5452, partial [Mycobacterium sp.]|nr:hypothetical protein [Mycobacterium sp.]